MKLIFSLISLFCLFLLNPLQSQNLQESQCPCCTDNHNSFDFWIGEWEVFDTLGNIQGTNRIEKIVKNCIISENWEGKSNYLGKSYNYFNNVDSTWNQLWIDQNGNQLIMKGHGSDGKMVLQSDLTTGRSGTEYRNRITWTRQENGDVVQQWDVVSKEGKILSTAFYGIYRKKE